MLVPARQILMFELSVHSDLLIVNIPKITKTRLLIIHKGGTMLSPLFDNCSPFKRARKANIKGLCSDKQFDERVFGLNYRSLGMKIKEWSDKAGVSIHTHSFRHYFATKLVEKRANIRVVQELLEHYPSISIGYG